MACRPSCRMSGAWRGNRARQHVRRGDVRGAFRGVAWQLERQERDRASLAWSSETIRDKSLLRVPSPGQHNGCVHQTERASLALLMILCDCRYRWHQTFCRGRRGRLDLLRQARSWIRLFQASASTLPPRPPRLSRHRQVLSRDQGWRRLSCERRDFRWILQTFAKSRRWQLRHKSLHPSATIFTFHEISWLLKRSMRARRSRDLCSAGHAI